jgi:flagellar biosynthesis/type III secretory pathway M-ring protein FliF/YscJ
MSLTSVAIDIAGIGVTSVAAGVIADAAMSEPQNWTVLGLLAAVVLGVGYGLVKQLEKSGDKTAAAIEKSSDRAVQAAERNAEAQAATATNLALLIKSIDEQRQEGEEKRRQIIERMEHLPDRVATALRK